MTDHARNKLNLKELFCLENNSLNALSSGKYDWVSCASNWCLRVLLGWETSGDSSLSTSKSFMDVSFPLLSVNDEDFLPSPFSDMCKSEDILVSADTECFPMTSDDAAGIRDKCVYFPILQLQMQNSKSTKCQTDTSQRARNDLSSVAPIARKASPLHTFIAW